ncbi:POTE ankyrin domain family member A-like [Callithrix jacchus]|uniref:CCDC144C-like coiled-coil domain-containing protein n=1 Tax=Callithrix jacchus TaxID=9483 RepID=A0A8I4A3N7_CALJA|nr:POTE ankyrin domain family member A-like [Callithrix jacchus]
MGAEVSPKPSAPPLKKPFGLRSKMGKWYCLCFPCCWGSGKNNVGAWGDHDDSAFREPRYHVRREDLGKLHRAAWWGKVPRADLIVMLRGPGVNKRDKKKRTALHLACANGNPEVVKLLLDRQCDLHVLDSKKRTALIKAVQCQEDECALMLLEHGTDPNIPDVYGNTALHYAVYNEDKLLARALLLCGANTESANKSGLTPLLLGVHRQKEQMVKFLIKKKANLNALDRFGRTALILAVCCGSASIVSILLQQDVDVFSQDASGWTAEDYAISSHHDIICQLLSDYKEKQMSKNSSQNSNPEQDLKMTSEEEPQRLKGSENRQPEKMSQEPDTNKDCEREAEEEMQKHGSNHVESPENLTNGVAPGCGDYGLIQRRRSRKPENQQSSSTENEQYHRPEKKPNENNKVKSQIHSVDDLDDISWPSEVASEDYDSLYSNYETYMLLNEQLNMDFNDSASLSKIQDAVLSDEHLLELQNNQWEQLTIEMEQMENMIHVLEKELSETKEAQLPLLNQKGEFEQEFSTLRSALKQEEEKTRNADMLYKKGREELKRKQEEYEKEFEMNQQHEQTLQTRAMEFRTVRNNLDQIALCQMKDEDLLHENCILQEELAMLRLELDIIKHQNQLKEKKYLEDIESEKEKNDSLRNAIKLTEETLAKTVFQYSEQLITLTTENKMLSSELKNEKRQKERLEMEM